MHNNNNNNNNISSSSNSSNNDKNNNNQWVHAGIFSFLASAAATLPLQDAIVSRSTQGAEDPTVSSVTKIWTSQVQSATPVEAMRHIQKAWDTLMAAKVFEKILTDDSNTQADKVSLRAAATPHAGDWLHAPPITAVGLRLSDEAIRVAAGFRLGSRTCQPHSYVCGAMVHAKEFHGLSCKRSAPRQIRHAQMNDITWRSVKKAQYPAVQKPVDCHGRTEKTEWGNDDSMDEREAVGLGRDYPRYVCELLYWRDIDENDSSGRQSEENKTTKYIDLAKTHHSVPIAIETGGAWNKLALEFITELGRRISSVTQELRETQFLFQLLLISFQKECGSIQEHVQLRVKTFFTTGTLFPRAKP